MKKLNNQLGFSVIEVLLVVLILGLLGGLGWEVYQNHHKKAASSSVASTSNTGSATNPSPTTTAPTSAQKAEYTAKVGMFALSLDPKYSIIVTHDSGGEGCSSTNVDIGTKTSLNSNVVVDETYNVVRIAALGKECGQTVQKVADGTSTDFQSKVSYLGKSAIKIGPFGIGDEVDYVFSNNGIVYHITYGSDSASTATQKDLVAGWTFK